MSEFAGKKDIQQIDRARVALNMKNSEGQQDSSLKHLEKLKEKLGKIDGIVTICIVCNVTGDTVIFVTHHDWVGKVLKHFPFLKEIENGEHGVFMHVGFGSVGAVVYRAKSPYGVDCDCMVAWNNPSDSHQNSAYTEVRESRHQWKWDIIREKLLKSGNTSESEWQGISSHVKIGNGESPTFEAVLKLKYIK